MRPIVTKVGPLGTAGANTICKSQTPTTGALTINGNLSSGGVATMDTPRQVLITTAGDESKNTFTLKGTNWAQDAITETVTGPNKTTAASVLSYNTVTAVTISGNASGAVTVGTNGIADSPWVRLDEWANPVVTLACALSGTGNYTVQQSMDDPNSPTNPVNPQSMTWTNNATSGLVNATTTQAGSITAAPTFVRVLLNSGSGSVTMTTTQLGVAPY